MRRMCPGEKLLHRPGVDDAGLVDPCTASGRDAKLDGRKVVALDLEDVPHQVEKAREFEVLHRPRRQRPAIQPSTSSHAASPIATTIATAITH
jgi:hypothetical protein